MDWTVLMAEVVGDVEASLSRSVLDKWLGLEECLSLEQLGLLGMSECSHEQFGEQGGS